MALADKKTKASSSRVVGESVKNEKSWSPTWLLAGLLVLGPALLFLHDDGGAQGGRRASSLLDSLLSKSPQSTPVSSDVKGKAKDDGLAALFSNLRPRPRLHADRLKTTRCAENAGVTDSRGRQRPLVQYAIMIDAGSTGSRIHVYKFNNCASSPELETEVFDLVKGGLSAPAYSASADLAADSLRPLLDLALREVPESLRSCTPISVKATAGLRLLGKKKAEDILQAVRTLLEVHYPFPIADGAGSSGVEIMDGRDEGVFAFITVNYLLNRLGDEARTPSSSYGKDLVGGPKHSRPQTAAVLDLGGGSTQIVFEPRFENVSLAVKEEAEHIGMHPGEHVYTLSNFGSSIYTLYQNSYLGYGLMQARTTVNALTLHAYLLSHPLGGPPRAASRSRRKEQLAAPTIPRDEPQLESIPPWEGMDEFNTHVPSPCYGPHGKREVVRVDRVGALGSAASQSELDQRSVGTSSGTWLRRSKGEKPSTTATTASSSGSVSRNVTFFGGGGGFAGCRRFVEIMMDKDASCALPPCTFAGVYQPPLVSTFRGAPIIALSYFYDRLVPLLGTTQQYRYQHIVQPAPSASLDNTITAQGNTSTVEVETNASFTPRLLRELAEKVCRGPVRRSNVTDADIMGAYADFFDDDTQEQGSGAAARLASIEASLWDWDPIFPPSTHPLAAAELFHRPESCLDLTYMYALLSHGYELPEEREVVLAKKVGGVELGWCLGAQLAILEDEALRCRNHEQGR
ncbi:unnamed protein product [Tilletia controversa]|uniref:guanosine-diphosphatase n=3 Tax=Tilletia TaxID=13289 RepID=A0A8X7T052_9BASI|nr:hypothetical protein CF336_g754 [Tilletia laevis]KAE8203173.1 hypothetical protein CF328_g1792 [Tilletia controversa]KAE8265204.1 hypothetical protein A4X03_0g429 [Tilletia caries]KAE8208437.1 hypothetical protein CF335_g419 [Tilletia laevis]KAE8253459.1 hypothetical protein A4X06_0g1432 [Tilletia controversa]